MSVAGSTGWPRAVEPLEAHGAALSRRAVHVWGTSLIVTPSARDALTGVLAPDERERASRFRFERDRDRFVAARGRLRLLLGAYAGRPAATLRFEYGPQGKPALRGPSRTGGLRFNLSHSGDVAVYALAIGRDVGVDVEQLRAVPEMDEIVERWFPDEERLRYAAGAAGDRVRAFFELWTRREALLKARGEGLSAFGQVSGQGWALATWEPSPGYLTSIAAEGERPAFDCWWAEPVG